jgi:hypothetical protein
MLAQRFLYNAGHIIAMPGDENPEENDVPVASRPIEMHMMGYEVVEKRATSSGTSGRIYVPPSWIGKLVRAVRLEE